MLGNGRRRRAQRIRNFPLIGVRRRRERAWRQESGHSGKVFCAGSVGRQRNRHETDRGIERDIFHDFLILLLVISLYSSGLSEEGPPVCLKSGHGLKSFLNIIRKRGKPRIFISRRTHHLAVFNNAEIDADALFGRAIPGKSSD